MEKHLKIGYFFAKIFLISIISVKSRQIMRNPPFLRLLIYFVVEPRLYIENPLNCFVGTIPKKSKRSRLCRNYARKCHFLDSLKFGILPKILETYSVYKLYTKIGVIKVCYYIHEKDLLYLYMFGIVFI